MPARISKSNKIDALPVGNFGERLRYCRLHADETQEAVGQLLGVSKGSVYAYEQGNNYPHVESLPVIAKHFGVSLEWLLTGEAETPVIKKSPPEHPSKSGTAGSGSHAPERLTPLQVATRNLLTEVAEAGLLSNAECLELMMRWQEKLDKRSAGA
jgi:transcriptional regulator with XRE-family HTH domain